MPYKKKKALSRSISPSRGPHPGGTANGTSGNILFPDSQYQLRHGHPGKTCLKALVSLKGEDKLQVPGPGAAVKEAVVTDLLETAGEHMEQEAPDEPAAAHGDGAFWASWL